MAALTLPSLIADYQEKVLVNQAKKSYAVIMNALTAYNYENESVGNYSTLMDANKSSEEILNDFAKFFNVIAICKSPNLKKCGGSYKIKTAYPRNNGSGKNYVLYHFPDRMLIKDGSIVSLERSTTVPGACYFEWQESERDADGNFILNPDGSIKKHTATSFRCGRIMVDTNGLKGPNRMGSDVFTFLVRQKEIAWTDSEGSMLYPLSQGIVQPYKNYGLDSDYGT